MSAGIMPSAARRSSLLLAAALLGAGSAGAQGFRYAEGTGAYQVTVQVSSTQETAGQKAEVQVKSRQRLTLGIAKHGKDTLDFSVRIDSITMEHSQAGAVDLSKLVGTTVTAALTPAGRVLGVHPAPGLDGAQADQMVRFLPHVGGALRVGATWTDTLAGKVEQGGLTVDRQIITTQRVVGDTVVHGEKGWRILRDAKSRITGSGVTQGQAIALEGTSTGGGTYVVTTAGLFLGAALTDHTESKFTMAANGVQVGTITNAMATVERVRDKK